MAKLKVLDAAKIADDTFEGRNAADIDITLDVGGAQALFLKSKTLVIPGTNELRDWLEFNLDTTHDVPLSTGFAAAIGDSGAAWHAGFLEHAQLLYGFAKALKPKVIIGHSLGGASAQILGLSLKVPAICFGAPTPYAGNLGYIQGEGWALNICRRDDQTCYTPGSLFGYRHIGSRHWLYPDGPPDGDSHSMPNYIELLAKAPGNVPATWPR